MSKSIIFNVPFVSQYSAQLPKNWQWRSCGIACVKMLIEFYGQKKHNDVLDLKTVLDRGLKVGAYVEGVGWSHAGLVSTANFFGFDGYNRDLADKPANLALDALKEELSLRPVIASVKFGFDPNNKNGHLVVVCGADEKFVYINDPAEINAKLGITKIALDKFLSAFKKRLILIRPKVSSKLERIQSSKLNLKESFLAQIHGSVGTQMFKHLYLNLNGKRVDVLENGGLSCSAFVSSILYMWGLIKDNHAKTEHTLKDMTDSGWYKITQPKIGCVILWEPSGVGRRTSHLGFYIGNQKAISNDSDKTGVPIVHHYTYGNLKGKSKRKIQGLYWHQALDVK